VFGSSGGHGAAVAAERMIGYARVSTADQADRGASLEAQEDKIRAYCGLHDLELIEIKVEVLSARTMNRPKLQDALAQIKRREADGLVIWNLDRLARKVRDVSLMIEEYFSEGGARLVSVTEHIDTQSAGGRLVVNVLSSVHQWESERVGERTKATMSHMKAQGYWTGGRVPYGFQAQPRRHDSEGNPLPRRLTEDPSEQEVISASFDLRERGLTLKEIASELRSRGFSPRCGSMYFGPQFLANITTKAG